MRVLQIITYAAVEKWMENKGKFLWHHDAGTGAAAVGGKDEAIWNSAKIKLKALAVIELCLFECISKWGSEPVSHSVENST